MVEKWYPGANVVYGDTDSVMVAFDTGDLKGEDALRKSFELGEEAAAKISATFKAPIELEFEKVYWPYLLFSKKRYAGLMYTDPNKSDYIDAKGIQLVRRDITPFVKNISKDILNEIMYNKNIKQAIEMAKTAARKLLNNQVPISDLILSKSLRRISYDYTKPTADKRFKVIHGYANGNQPHVTVAAKIEERDTGSGPRSGDRVPYVFIDTGNSKDLQYLKAEDPSYVADNNIRVDVEYYIDHALMSPLESLFELFLSDPKKEIFLPVKLEYYHNQQISLTDFFKTRPAIAPAI
jgi:DNA polymerase delta subunit 1